MYSTSARPLAALASLAMVVVLAVPARTAAQQIEPILSTITPEAGREAWQASPADSARALGRARSAQARFELVRRNNLPWTWDRGSSPCDERIGRFCLWYGDGESRWQPPPDPEPTVVARIELIARLDTAAALIPGDWWVAGQRVRYLVEADRATDAVAAASACRSREPGWCDALLGYALHSAGDYVRADSAFAAALARMPVRVRQRWTDLSELLDAPALRAYRRLDGAERDAFEARYWWLAEPLYMLPGNDRRTAHFSRHVLDRLQDRARQTEGISWGSDLRELLLRYGSPAGWERIRPRMPHQSASSVLTRYPRGSRHFDPPLDYVSEPLAIPSGEWDINARAARTSYAPAYAAPVEEIEHQVSVFRRGDSAVVVAALRLPADSSGAHHAADAALVVWTGPDAPPIVLRGRSDREPAVLTATLPTEPALLSLEAHAPSENRAARARFGVPLGPPPAHGLSASDLLLLTETGPLPLILDDALPHARASSEARAGDRIALYWEVYGLARSDLPLAIDVRLVDDNVGWLRRAAVRAGIARDQTPLNVHWQEVPDDPGPVHGRSVVIELPEVSPGDYTLQLTLTPRGREALRTSKRLTIIE